MNIFQILAENLRRGPVTLRLPARVAPPDDFRGAVHLEPERCVGCATCAYVCTSGAIEVTGYDGGYEWAYEPGRCTFCGRCVPSCPTQALAMASERPPVHSHPAELQQVHRLDYPLCPECGRPAQPVNDLVLARAFVEISEEVRAWSRLCERCRGRHHQPALLDTGCAGRSRG